jgi:hypothetical protein
MKLSMLITLPEIKPVGNKRVVSTNTYCEPVVVMAILQLEVLNQKPEQSWNSTDHVSWISANPQYLCQCLQLF